MRNIMILAAIMVGLGTVMAQMADKMTATPALAGTAHGQRRRFRDRRARRHSQPQHPA